MLVEFCTLEEVETFKEAWNNSVWGFPCIVTYTGVSKTVIHESVSGNQTPKFHEDVIVFRDEEKITNEQMA